MAKTRSRWIWLWGLLLAVAAPTREAASVDLLVSSPASGQITQLDGATGVIEGLFVLPGAEGLSTAAGLRLGPDGRLCVGSDGSVFRFNASTGVFVDKLATGKPGPGYFLVFAPDGSLFGNVFGGNQVFRFDGATGALSYIGGPPLVPTGVEIGPDGNLYVGDFSGNRVVRFNPTTGADLGLFGTVPGAAGATRFGPDGRLYVALFLGNDIVRLDGTTGVSLGSFIPPGDRHPAGPSGLAWGPDGNLYVSSSGTGEVLRYNGTTGAFMGVFASGLGGLWGLEFVPDVTPPYPLLPPVDTTSGPVRGFLADDVRRYLGVPYAEAPTGTRRWKRPERKAASQTELIAVTPGLACPQLSGTSVVGNEDCLSVSIWRPDSPPATPLPVLFYIHGGSHVTGAAGGIADGAVLARSQNIIVAEAQYRLGALGFFGLPALAAEDPNGSTGNYGLLDHLEALRWLRDNVAAFGGDPNQITIAGESAGGHSVCALLASPLADGLFRAGIVQSGQCIQARPLDLPAASPVRTDPYFGPTVYDHSTAIASSAGCIASELACLRGKTAEQMVQALGAQPRSLSGEQRAIMAIDGYVLTDTPIVMLRQGAADQRPLMIGSVANEATWFLPTIGNIITNAAIYEAVLRAQAGNTRADALLPLYPAGSDPAETFRRLFEDTIFVCAALDAADAVATNGSPTWVYQMTFPPTYLPGSPNAPMRTFHTLDLYYVFGTWPQLPASWGIAVDADDAALSEAMQNAWGSFVRTGVPSTSPAWPVYAPTTPGDLASVSVLNFDIPNSTVAGNLFRSGRCAALLPVANFLDADRDIATYEEDNCPITSNMNQADAESDLVGNACDNCRNVSNPRVAADFLTTNPWATLTGGQRDDDHDGYGNKCDGKFPGISGLFVSNGDLTEWRASNTKNRTLDQCGTAGNRPCAIYDLDETGLFISNGDLIQWRLLNTKQPGPKCPTCPLACTAGTAGNCQ